MARGRGPRAGRAPLIHACEHRPGSGTLSAATSPSPDELRSLCVEIAQRAAAHARQARLGLGAGRRADHDTKSSAVDPVTEFDRQTEQVVVEHLGRLRPDDAIVGEEGTDRAGTSGLAWHVDPIDGTVNYVYDLPMWCTSIGVVRDATPVAGAICAPMLGETFSAAKGAGAFLTTADGAEQPIHASTHDELSTSLITTGFSYHLDDRREQQAQRIAALLPRVRDIRRTGSAALDLAFVAAGRVDAYFEQFINSWDVAAGVLIVTEAGGTVTAFDGAPLDVLAPSGVLAAGSALHPVVDAVLVRD